MARLYRLEATFPGREMNGDRPTRPKVQVFTSKRQRDWAADHFRSLGWKVKKR
jgi:hypothetical protein